jgi:hypothetical protein
MRRTLERIERSRLVIVDVPHLTPLSFPLWAESLRTQHVTSESWSERVKRMVVELEAAADGRPEGREKKKGAGRKKSTSRRRSTRRSGVA